VAEVDRVFGAGSRVTHASLRELVFLENVVKESLRLHPPLFMLVRVANQDYTYKEWFIPKGTWIVISPTVSHQIPEVFHEPAKFDPDRYAPPREEDKRDFAYIAFGGGRHKCLGNAFAILQIKAILALLLGQFEFELYGDEIASDFHGLVVGPKEPCRVRYRKRETPSVTMSMAADLGKAAESAMAQAAGCPAHAEAPKKKLKVVLDRDLCQGHAVCVGECSEVFRLGADGKVELVTNDIAPALRRDSPRARRRDVAGGDGGDAERGLGLAGAAPRGRGLRALFDRA
jgi:sterol 14-demethylase